MFFTGALTVERTRIEVAVSNIANAESTRGPDGEPYRRRDVLLAAEPVTSFDAVLGQVIKAFGTLTARQALRPLLAPDLGR